MASRDSVDDGPLRRERAAAPAPGVGPPAASPAAGKGDSPPRDDKPRPAKPPEGKTDDRRAELLSRIEALTRQPAPRRDAPPPPTPAAGTPLPSPSPAPRPRAPGAPPTRALTPAGGTPLRKTSDLSALAATTPIGHASPLGAAPASELASATAAPAVTAGRASTRPAATQGEVAAAAASILAGSGPRPTSTDGKAGPGADDQAAESAEEASERASVRENLVESAALARASAQARARVAALRARGASLPELDGRLAAAELLSKRGEPEAALRVLEEVLVLTSALVAAFGAEGAIDIPDPLDVRIDARLTKVFDRASEAARARTDELLASARFAEKVEEIARARLEELLTSKRLAARIEEVAQRHAESVASAAVEALLSSDGFLRAVDARARARAEEASASVRAGASPEAIEAAAERALARREKDAPGKLDRLLDPAALEERLSSLVSSLVKRAIADEGTIQGKLRALVAEEVARHGAAPMDRDELQLRRLVDTEIARYEAVAQPTEKLMAEQADLIARSEALQAALDERFEVLRAAAKKDVLEELERIAGGTKKRADGRPPSGEHRLPRKGS